MRAWSRRLLLLLILLVTCGGGVLLYSRSQQRLDSAARAAREEGLGAFGRHEYPVAMLKLGQFLRRLEPDAEALLRYAQSIRRLRGADAEHLESAVAALRRCTGLAPDHVEAHGELLELYLQTGVRAEALEQAEWFLARNPDDARAIRAKAITLTEMRQYREALALLEARVPPEASRLEEHLLHLALLASLERPPAEFHAYAARVIEAQAADPRFRLMLARVHLLTDDLPAAREVLGSLVPLAKGDAAFARLLLDHLDRAGLPQESLRVLVGFAPEELDSALQVDLVRRLWEGSDASAVATAVAAWGIAREDLPSPILGYEALALARLGRGGDARKPLNALKSRGGQRVAKAWVALLEEVVLAERPALAARLASCLRALEFDPGNAVVQYELGRAYRDAGEVELAVRAFHAASGLARSWSEPASAGARLMAESGRLMGALRAATEARARHSTDPGVALLLAMAQGAAGGAPGGSMPERVLSTLGGLDLPDADLLPIRLSVLTAAGRFDDARALIEQALAPSSKPDGAVLLACAVLSHAKEMGLEARCYQRYEELHGSTPGLALALARDRARTAGADGGLALLRERSHKACSTPAAGAIAGWWAAEASFLESFARRTEALAAWREAVRSGRDDPMLLRATLEAASPWDDRDLTRAAIDALKAATNATCLNWRFYDARWLLSEPKAGVIAQEAAIAHLRSILAQAPEQVRARLLLARIHEVRGEAGKALEQLQVARSLLGASATLELRIARLQLDVSDWAGGRETLQRILGRDAARPGAPLSASERMAMAAMFARLGERESVLGLLAEGGSEPYAADDMEGRAALFAAVGELGMAESLVGSVLAVKESPRSLRLGAALAEFSGHTKEAEALLARLDVLTEDALTRERQRAEHYLRVGRLDRAEDHQRRVVALAGASSRDWIALLAYQVAQGKKEEVAATLAQARSLKVELATSGEPSVSAEALAAASRDPSLRALGVAYLQDPANRGVVEQVLRALGSIDGSSASAVESARLRSLAQQAPRSLALQLTIADILIRRRDLEDAAALLQAAAVAFPMSPEPLRAMAACQRAMGRTERAAEAARRWRERVSGVPLEPDYFLAQQAKPEEVGPLLEAHLPVAVARGMVEVLELYGQARIVSGEVARVREVFEPWLVSGERNAIAAWASLAGFLAARGEGGLATEWLERDVVSAAVAKDLGVRVAVAAAWMVLAQVSGGSQARETALSTARGVPLDAELDAGTWEKLGQVYAGAGDAAAAERSYRRALGLAQRPLIALNNLAALLTDSGRAPEALPLAEELVRRRPDVAEYRDTLATVQQKVGNAGAALVQLEQNLRLEPANARWAMRVLEVLLAQGERKEAERRLRQFRSVYPEPKMSEQQRTQWAAVVRAVESGAGAGG